MKLTLYLFKESVQNFDHCLKPQTDTRKYRDITNEENNDIVDTFRIYTIVKDPTIPSWVQFLGGYVQSEAYEKMKATAPSAVILFKIKTADNGTRIMAASNGSAYSALDTSLIVRGFGLKATLNSIIPGMIKSLEYKDMRSRSLKRNESAATATSIANFGFTYNNEMIKSVSGRAADEELGRSISGADSLKITVPDLQISQLQQTGEKAFDRFMQKKYQEHFDFIDHVQQIQDPIQIVELDIELVELLAKPSPPAALTVSHINQAQFAESDHIQLTVRGQKERFDEIDIKSLHRLIRDGDYELDINTLRAESHIYGCDPGEKPMTAKVSLYKLLNCQIQKDGETYVLNGGVWHKILPSFAEGRREWFETNAKEDAIKSISWNSKTIEKHLPSEMDAKWTDLSGEWLNAKGRGKIFAADACHEPTNSLVAFKNTGSAISMQHLADRAITCAELLRDGDDKIVDFIRKTTPLAKKDADFMTAVNRIQFVFIIGYKNSAIEEMNTFDLIALSRATRALNRLGFKTVIQPLRLV